MISISYSTVFVLLHFSIALNRMKTARRSLEDLNVSMNKIARRWSTDGYGKLPIEPITNYLDVGELEHL